MSAPITSEKSAVNPNQDPHAGVFIVATLFLFLPVAILLSVTFHAQTDSEPVSLAAEYRNAVLQSEQPGIAPVSQSLVAVDTGPKASPVTVVTWTKGGDAYKDKSNSPDYKYTWVTVVPNLKKFCQEFIRLHGEDPAQLSHRLEQRLGLPPDSGYDTFIEFTIDPRDPKFFRPCADPSPGQKTCMPEKARTAAELQNDLKSTDPKTKQELEHRYWFLNNYYGSFASKNQYPWTSLGYTFDWARKDSGDFERIGESEFIVAPDTPIKTSAPQNTAQYCKP